MCTALHTSWAPPMRRCAHNLSFQKSQKRSMAGRCCKLLECLDLHGIANELGAADSELRSHFFKPTKRV